MNVVPVVTLGFLLGMRHATDADHVVAVSTIVTRARSLRAAAPIGVLWGLGHTITILLVGGAIVLFGLVIPPRIGLGMELLVGLMLVLLGVVNMRRGLRHAKNPRAAPPGDHSPSLAPSMRPLYVGLVHGAAGSGAVALLGVGAIREPLWAVCYLLVFGLGTVMGMLLVTTALAMPMAAMARRFHRLQSRLAWVTGLGSVILGSILVYDIGVVHRLFTRDPQWTPQ